MARSSTCARRLRDRAVSRLHSLLLNNKSHGTQRPAAAKRHHAFVVGMSTRCSDDDVLRAIVAGASRRGNLTLKDLRGKEKRAAEKRGDGYNRMHSVWNRELWSATPE